MEALKRLAKAEDQLFTALDDLGREVYEVYQDAWADVTAERDKASFVYGFQLCVGLLLGE